MAVTLNASFYSHKPEKILAECSVQNLEKLTSHSVDLVSGPNFSGNLAADNLHAIYITCDVWAPSTEYIKQND